VNWTAFAILAMFSLIKDDGGRSAPTTPHPWSNTVNMLIFVKPFCTVIESGVIVIDFAAE